LLPAMYACVRGSCVKQYHHFFPYGMLWEVQEPMDPRRGILFGQTDLV
jgi:hypothetical protein